MLPFVCFIVLVILVFVVAIVVVVFVKFLFFLVFLFFFAFISLAWTTAFSIFVWARRCVLLSWALGKRNTSSCIKQLTNHPKTSGPCSSEAIWRGSAQFPKVLWQGRNVLPRSKIQNLIRRLIQKSEFQNPPRILPFATSGSPGCHSYKDQKVSILRKLMGARWQAQKLSEFPAWQMPGRNCTRSGGSSCMSHYSLLRLQNANSYHIPNITIRHQHHEWSIIQTNHKSWSL